MAIGRTAVPHRAIVTASGKGTDIQGGLAVWKGPAGVVARSLVMIAAAVFAILVLLPAAVAAQAAIHM